MKKYTATINGQHCGHRHSTKEAAEKCGHRIAEKRGLQKNWDLGIKEYEGTKHTKTSWL